MSTTGPIEVKATRYQCPHCLRTRSKRAAAVAHITRCWNNPQARGCKTCTHFAPAAPGPYPEDPGWPEECGAGRDLTSGPTTDCPLWTTR